MMYDGSSEETQTDEDVDMGEDSDETLDEKQDNESEEDGSSEETQTDEDVDMGEDSDETLDEKQDNESEEDGSSEETQTDEDVDMGEDSDETLDEKQDNESEERRISHFALPRRYAKLPLCTQIQREDVHNPIDPHHGVQDKTESPIPETSAFDTTRLRLSESMIGDDAKLMNNVEISNADNNRNDDELTTNALIFYNTPHTSKHSRNESSQFDFTASMILEYVLKEKTNMLESVPLFDVTPYTTKPSLNESSQSDFTASMMLEYDQQEKEILKVRQQETENIQESSQSEYSASMMLEYEQQ
ncbi:hypothetical protein L1987_18523 [Smallanthus sonchifolius]|uniref:Uncharacterized protein n=1 Tax=Smallanthus sonchifolius TaxID=185202 RepID=A0ACB9J006_9ASTR|nr:hypothetical protein L1987_18523 [Smallanthus sonchifolius]